MDIKLACFDNFPDALSEEIAACFARLPRWRRERAERYHFPIDQFLCAKSYLMLCDLLHEHYDITQQPTFCIGVHGKPTLTEFPHIHFNISHCKNAILVAVAEAPIGCDIETIGKPPRPELLERTCSAAEIAAIHAAANPTVAFYRLWTQKEAYLKFTGVGLTEHLPTILEENRHKIILETHENLGRGYVQCIAHKQC